MGRTVQAETDRKQRDNGLAHRGVQSSIWYWHFVMHDSSVLVRDGLQQQIAPLGPPGIGKKRRNCTVGQTITNTGPLRGKTLPCRNIPCLSRAACSLLSP
ncbi:hypothetical protein DPEC_G00058620 [Dallia pectoralis]|uniref:Uncharacterized protein n=1 Tax=Dallia pectoralis TaxID=75939 RepID=A0ACC2H6C7_DALPE|nr:hypothetical protein DPEC_G00058620 [Dallia pectoralis]